MTTPEMTTLKAIASQSDSFVQAIKTHGAPARAKALVIGGPADLEDAVARLLKPRTLVVRQDEDAFDLSQETGPYGLVVAGEGLERASLAGLRARMQAIARILARSPAREARSRPSPATTRP